MRYLFPNEIDYYAEINGFEVLKHSTWLKDRIPTIEDWSAFFQFLEENEKNWYLSKLEPFSRRNLSICYFDP